MCICSDLIERYEDLDEKLSKAVISNLISFLNKQLSFKVDDLVDLVNSKRDYLALSGIIDSGASTDPRHAELLSLSKSYSGKLFRVGNNGGLGVTIHVLDKDAFKKEYNIKESEDV